MSEKPTIEQLLRQWVVLRKQGEEPDVGELCKDCPELADELRGRIAQLQADDAGTPRDTEPARPSSTQSHTADGKAKIQIGGYTILREIGHGGQGAIFKALQHSTGRHVAVKVLSETRQLSDIERARFEREAQVLAALAHPHIVSIIDRGHTAAGSAYFTMEYIEGQPLDRWLDEYRRDHPPADIPSNPGELLRLFMKIADAVNVAHLRGIIHRDLKPSNILVDDKGNPHILDFGLARLGLPAEVYSEQHRIVTMTGQFIGTLPWVSPEQAEGLTSKIDTRTDVYSLGVILYEMLTAEFPYEVVGNMRDVLDNILRAQPKPPSTVIEARLAKQAQRRRRWRKTPQNPITPDLEAIVLKALNKKPEDRYQNAGELARDIGNYLSGRPLEARGLTRVAARRYGPWIAVAAAAVLFLVTGLIWVLGLPRRTPASGASAPVALTSVREPQVLPLIPDPNLRAVVKEALGLKDRDLTLADVLRLTALDASGKAIQDLTGLEYAEKLKHLDLSENQISHIAPLAGLTGLEELSLADNRIADLRPLARLTGLTRLNLARNRDISDITPLVDLKHLTTLNLYDNRVRDISVLAGLARLRVLDLSGNSVTDVEPLANLMDLTFLHLPGNQLADIRSLAGLTNLTELNLEDNNIVDITPLVGLNKLVHLLVRDNPLGAAAYSVSIPQLRSKNPTIDVVYDTPGGEEQAAVSPTDTFAVVDPSPLVEGVRSVWDSGDSGPLAALRPEVVPVVTGDEDTSFPSLVLAATGFGQGRVVASSLSHFPNNEALDQYADSRRLALNIVDWLDQRRTKRVLVTTGHREWGGGDNFSSLDAALQEKGYSFLRWDRPLFPGALANIGVVIVAIAWAPFTTEEIAALNAFVRNGGGLFLLGLGWSWPPAHPGLTLDDYPMNKLGADYGVRWLDRCVTDPTNQHNDRPVFHRLYPNTLKQPSYSELVERVRIPDERLKRAIQAALGLPGKQDLTREDLLQLVSLPAVDGNIADLTGLEHAPNLEELWLWNNRIVHLTPLAGLSRLREVNVERNAIADITPLARLPHLRKLYLADNQIEDILPLSMSTNLEHLDLNHNSIRNPGPLRGLTQLTRLCLNNNGIDDLQPLMNLTNLQELDLAGNQIRDISILARMTKLKSLHLWSNQIEDLSPLRDLTNLTWLGVGHNRDVRETQSLARLVNLTFLAAEINQIADIAPLAGLRKLETLRLGFANITDIRALAELQALQELQLQDNHIQDISPLTGLRHLTKLDVQKNPLAPAAYTTAIPQIRANNPGIDLLCDAPQEN